MDNKANTVLSSAIANHGNQLLTSNAFCKVYLTGYLAGHPQERDLLITLKEQEIPKAFLDFKEGKLTEVELQNFIKSARENSKYSTRAIAWGIDAWAAAVGLPKPVRLNILEQCFDYSDSVLDFTIPTSKAVMAIIPQHNVSAAHWTSALYKTAAAASLAAVIWMVPSQESDNYASLKTPAPKVQLPAPIFTSTFEVASESVQIVNNPFELAPPTITTRIDATEMIDQTIESLKQSKDEKAPQPMVIGKSRAQTLRTKQLRADIDAYLQSGQ